MKANRNLPGITPEVPEPRLVFDVADIKLSDQDHPTRPTSPAGWFMDEGVTLIALIQHAWGLITYDNELIAEGPKLA